MHAAYAMIKRAFLIVGSPYDYSPFGGNLDKSGVNCDFFCTHPGFWILTGPDSSPFMGGETPGIHPFRLITVPLPGKSYK